MSVRHDSSTFDLSFVIAFSNQNNNVGFTYLAEEPIVLLFLLSSRSHVRFNS